jgi:hypothetical protein
MAHEHPDPPKPPGRSASNDEKLQYTKDIVVGPYSDKQKKDAIETCWATE